MNRNSTCVIPWGSRRWRSRDAAFPSHFVMYMHIVLGGPWQALCRFKFLESRSESTVTHHEKISWGCTKNLHKPESVQIHQIRVKSKSWIIQSITQAVAASCNQCMLASLWSWENLWHCCHLHLTTNMFPVDLDSGWAITGVRSRPPVILRVWNLRDHECHASPQVKNQHFQF